MTSNYIDITGLHLQSLADIVVELEDGFKTIYGTDVNVDPNSPDGQMINLFAQAKIDILDLISSVYGSFSPTSAIGTALDQRCAINGVTRQAATHTTVAVIVETDQIVALRGLSEGDGNYFTVADDAGNLFYLTTSASTGVGNTTMNFTAAEAGAIEVSPNSIQTISTITYGVLSVDNAGGALVAGIGEETDADLRLRRAFSVANPSSGYRIGLEGALLALDGVADAKVYENHTDTTDADGIPPHSIWCVTDGGTAAEIAEQIYLRRNAGCGMTGAETKNVTELSGALFPIKYSKADHVDLYIDLTVTSLLSTHAIDDDFIKQAVFDAISYGINETADYSAICSAVKLADPYAVITAGGVSEKNSDFHPYLAPDTIDQVWDVSLAKITVTVV